MALDEGRFLDRFRFAPMAFSVMLAVATVAPPWVGLERQKVVRRQALIAWCEKQGCAVECGVLPSEAPPMACFITIAPDIGRFRRLLGDRGVNMFWFEYGWLPTKEMQRELIRYFPESDFTALGKDWKYYDLDGSIDVPPGVINLERLNAAPDTQ